MERCIACGREFTGQGEVCADCQAQGHLHAASGAKPDGFARHEVTLALIGLSVLVFLLMVAFGASPRAPNTAQLIKWGANNGYYTLLYNQYWRLLSSNYVHIGIIHLVVNMYCLWGLGRLLELFYARKDYVLLYTYTGIAGSLLSVGLHPYVTSAGASGAIFGVAGVLLTTLKYGHLPLPEATRKTLFREILQFAGINLVVGFVLLGVDNAGHLGGLLSGLVVGGALGKHLDPSEASARQRVRRWLLLWLGLSGFFWLVMKWRIG